MGHDKADGHHDLNDWKWLGDGTLRAEDPEKGLGHIVPISTFNKIFAILCTLTIITVAASRVDFGEMNTVIAIVIASIKALLVALFFMHLKFEGKLIILYAIYPLILLTLLIGSSLFDIADREHPMPSWKMEPETRAKPAPAMHHEGAEGGPEGAAEHHS